MAISSNICQDIPSEKRTNFLLRLMKSLLSRADPAGLRGSSRIHHVGVSDTSHPPENERLARQLQKRDDAPFQFAFGQLESLFVLDGIGHVELSGGGSAQRGKMRTAAEFLA